MQRRILITSAVTAFVLLVVTGFYLQLKKQFVQKESEIRSRLVRIEDLPNGKKAVCNLDKKVTLSQLAVRSSATASWVIATDLSPLLPDTCGVSSLLPSLTHEFRALWEREDISRWEVILPYPSALHDFSGARQ
jgi:hypothetical protein